MSLPAPLHSLYLRGYFIVRKLLGLSLFEKIKFLKTRHRWPRIAPATTFTEKVFARKVGASDPRFPLLADKIAVRDWVAQRVGAEHLVPVVATYDYDDLDKLDLVPGQVIKCANRSGGVYFTSGDLARDRARFIERIRNDLDFDFAAWTGEPWYGEIQKRVLVEKFLEGADGSVPVDYKFFVFHGEVKAIQVHLDRFVDHKIVIFDRQWQRMPFMLTGYGMPEELPPPPGNLPRMIEIAEALGKDLDFVRVDLYEGDDERVYFGEMTLAPGSGLTRFDPVDYDRVFGTYW